MNASVTPVEVPWMGYRSHHQDFVENLRAGGIEVTTLIYPADCFYHLAKNSPRLIVLTTDFEGSVGLSEYVSQGYSHEIALEVFKRIRKMPKHANTPLIVPDGWGQEVRRKFVQIGGCDTLDINELRPSALRDLVMSRLR